MNSDAIEVPLPSAATRWRSREPIRRVWIIVSKVYGVFLVSVLLIGYLAYVVHNWECPAVKTSDQNLSRFQLAYFGFFFYSLIRKGTLERCVDDETINLGIIVVYIVLDGVAVGFVSCLSPLKFIQASVLTILIILTLITATRCCKLHCCANDDADCGHACMFIITFVSFVLLIPGLSVDLVYLRVCLLAKILILCLIVTADANHVFERLPQDAWTVGASRVNMNNFLLYTVIAFYMIMTDL